MLSFIVPTKNEAKAIAGTLEHLRRYPGANELIVSDGGSADGTVEIARRLADRVVVHEGSERQTIGGGRNAGAAVARGEILVFLDADVSVEDPAHFFDEALKIFAADPRIGAISAFLRVSSASETFLDRVIFSWLNYAYFFLNNVLDVGAASGEFQMIRASVFREVGGFNEKLVAGEDHDLFRRIARRYKTRFTPRLRVYHDGRRGHAVGWPKLLWTWLTNGLSVAFRGRSSSDVWEEIR